jgi:hypothetical protein
MKNTTKTSTVIVGLVVVFTLLAVGFILNLWGRVVSQPEIPLVDPSFISTSTVRASYAELVANKADLSDFDCYGCHEKGKTPPLRFDADHNLVIPKEHSDVVMGHGNHNRNNLCFNCHDENNLELLQTRDGRELKFSESPQLCGSCHGPTYRDWEAGAHGRTNGYWNRSMGPITRKDCVSCHNPHAPKFPGREPAPPPHPLRPLSKPKFTTQGEH